MTIKEAKHVVLWWMNLFGFKGLTMPWAIYLHPTRLNDTALIRHEMKHVEQMKRDGVATFMIKYVWWSVRYGYFNNPYEIEAREAERGE